MKLGNPMSSFVLDESAFSEKQQQQDTNKTNKKPNPLKNPALSKFNL